MSAFAITGDKLETAGLMLGGPGVVGELPLFRIITMAKAVGYGRTRRGNPERVLELAIVARIFGMISGAFSMVIFLLLLVTYAPYLALSADDLLEDVNLAKWRARFFTFNPSVFGNLWAPLVMGALSLCTHFRWFKCRWLTRSWGRFALWHFVQGLFANLGYCGGMGFIASVWSFLAALLGLCVYFLHPRIPVAWGIDIFEYIPRAFLARSIAEDTQTGGDPGATTLKSVVTMKSGVTEAGPKGENDSSIVGSGDPPPLKLRSKKKSKKAHENGNKLESGNSLGAV
ncbi:transmembrane protein [Cystoisospora suis]|uniref:Transmembrane protein n=1 Tax=Cystoisospora suis TaxID=483139 RepID=A0A2C6KIL7_9APIC|nr:transmembrane protein [Cystoisospora suis]